VEYILFISKYLLNSFQNALSLHSRCEVTKSTFLLTIIGHSKACTPSPDRCY